MVTEPSAGAPTGAHSAPRSSRRADPFGARRRLSVDGPAYFAVDAIGELLADPGRLPVTIRILLENALRHAGRGVVTAEHVEALAAWRPGVPSPPAEIPFMPSRVLLQDYTGVPAIVDLAALRDAVADAGGDPLLVRPHVPVDLVIDHSIQVDVAGSAMALAANVEREYARNRERYALLRWAQQAFAGLRVVPPGRGIVHQVNLEYLAQVVRLEADIDGGALAAPDTVVGTDSHTTMVDALGVLGFGVGGIEAEAVLLGFGLPSPMPRVVGVRLVGRLPTWSTATDLALRVTEMLRGVGVVGSFVEFSGDGIAGLSLADRATVSNMAPEYGATAALFPIDAETLAYLRTTGRRADHIALVERYAKEQRLWRAEEPTFDELVELDLESIEPSMAGPRRPQDRVPLGDVPRSFSAAFASDTAAGEAGQSGIEDGSVVIAAITSCTNTSNAALMITAGLVARNAVERGLLPAPWVKTSLAPGSRAVTEYLTRLGLQGPLDALGFEVVGYGCTTCIGNSGPLDVAIADAITSRDLATVAVLSGNRNFEGRIHPLVRAAYLASPPLVVAYALAGRIDVDLTRDPVGIDRDGGPVHLHELWPTADEVADALAVASAPDLYEASYRDVFEGDRRWTTLATASGDRFGWDPGSTYVAQAPFPWLGPRGAAATDGTAGGPTIPDVIGARVLVHLGDSVTTDHISPAGSIAADGSAGRWLLERGVPPLEFNSYGARRGHHEVMARGTFGNVRLHNLLVRGSEGPVTAHRPSGEVMPIFDAATRYAAEGIPLVVLAGREYGTGSSRDWAAKGPRLLGVRAVLAESFERIHRSNLVGMGILPLRLPEPATDLGLDGTERYDIVGVDQALADGGAVTVRATSAHRAVEFAAQPLINGPSEEAVYRAGGILPAILARLLGESAAARGAGLQGSVDPNASSSARVSTSGLAPSAST